MFAPNLRRNMRMRIPKKKTDYRACKTKTKVTQGNTTGGRKKANPGSYSISTQRGTIKEAKVARRPTLSVHQRGQQESFASRAAASRIQNAGDVMTRRTPFRVDDTITQSDRDVTEDTTRRRNPPRTGSEESSTYQASPPGSAPTGRTSRDITSEARTKSRSGETCSNAWLPERGRAGREGRSWSVVRSRDATRVLPPAAAAFAYGPYGKSTGNRLHAL